MSTTPTVESETRQAWHEQGNAELRGLRAGHADRYRLVQIVNDRNQTVIQVWDWPNSAEIAQRIVACVNGCAGLADPLAIPDAIQELRELVADKEYQWEERSHHPKARVGQDVVRLRALLERIDGKARGTGPVNQ